MIVKRFQQFSLKSLFIYYWHILSSELYLHAIFIKKLLFLAKKSVSNFFGSELGKMKLIFLIYTFFRTRVQKTGDSFFFFFFRRVLGKRAFDRRQLFKKTKFIVNVITYCTVFLHGAFRSKARLPKTLQKFIKKLTVSSFLHTGPKKHVD